MLLSSDKGTHQLVSVRSSRLRVDVDRLKTINGDGDVDFVGVLLRV